MKEQSNTEKRNTTGIEFLQSLSLAHFIQYVDFIGTEDKETRIRGHVVKRKAYVKGMTVFTVNIFDRLGKKHIDSFDDRDFLDVFDLLKLSEVPGISVPGEMLIIRYLDNPPRESHLHNTSTATSIVAFDEHPFCGTIYGVGEKLKDFYKIGDYIYLKDPWDIETETVDRQNRFFVYNTIQYVWIYSSEVIGKRDEKFKYFNKKS